MAVKPTYAELETRLHALEQAESKRKRAEAALRQSEHRYRLLFQMARDMCFIHDYSADGTPGAFMEVNEAACSALEYTPEEFHRLTPLDIIAKEDMADISAEAERLNENGHLVFEKTLIGKTGKRIPVEINTRIFNAADQPLALSIARDITDRKQSEEALRESEARFDLAMRFASDGLFDWNLETGEIYYSPGWKSMLGYSEGEIENELSEWERLTKAEDVASSWTMIRELLAGKRDRFEKEIQMRHKNGRWVDILSRANVVTDETGKPVRVVGTHVDITGRKEFEREILRQKQIAERYLQLAGVMFIGLDADGNVTVANQKACEILECDETEILGRNWFDHFIPADIRDSVRSVFSKLIAGAMKPGEYHENPVLSKSGTVKTIAWHNTFIPDENGDIIGVLGSGENITEKRRLEARLQHAQRMESLGNLAGGIAHDFNNILFPIIGISELLLDDLPAGGPEHANVLEILRAGKRGGELVKQILAFGRQAEQKKAPVFIQRVLKEALRLSRSTIPADVRIVQNIEGDCRAVTADPTQIHQVAVNLITNAYHALPETGGNISVTLTEKTLENEDTSGSSLRPGRYVMLMVSDNGRGIEPEVIDRIFEPYFTTKEPGKGTGLGLAVVYGIIKEHGGDIRVYSEVDKGTTFLVYLPPASGKTVPGDHKPEKPYRKGDERILLVDDDESVARIEQMTLERLGYRVTTLHDAVEALDLFRADPGAFDVILTDMSMPRMTGDRLAVEIKKIRPSVPIIICTGFSERVDEQKAAEMGVDGYLMKPLIRAEIARAIRHILDNTARTDPD
jgi:PAS domain S-box-containing protein